MPKTDTTQASPITDNRRKLYEELLTRLFTLFANPSMLYPLDVLNNDADRQAWAKDQMGMFIAEMQPRLMLYGSRNAYSAWTGLLHAGRGGKNPQEQFTNTMLAFDDLVRALRTELGEDCSGFERGAFIAPFMAAAKK